MRKIMLWMGIISLPLIADQSVARDWTYSLALQAATWGAPIVTMYALRDQDALSKGAKASPGEIWRMEDVITPELAKKAGYVTPNVNVIYGFGFMDLSKEPVILEAPDSQGRYYMVEIVDMWTNAFAYIGGKSTGFKGGKFALVGPTWKGDLPLGVKRINCPTPWILLQPRVHVYTDQKLDLVGARKVLQEIGVKSLREYLGKEPLKAPNYHYIVPDPVDRDLPVSALMYKDPLQFWEIMMSAINENPPPQDQIDALLPMFEPLGMVFKKPWDRLTLSESVVSVMKEVAEKIGQMLDELPIGRMEHGAFFPPSNIGAFGSDYVSRAIVARVGLTANTASESVYWMYTMDNEGNPLIGTKKYQMTFKEGIPFYKPGFWSITLYDKRNNYIVPNKIDRYMIGSDTTRLKRNPDGTTTIYIQKEHPGKGKESNWLPTGDGPFYLIPRAYCPKPETIQLLSNPNSWPVPEVVFVKSE